MHSVADRVCNSGVAPDFKLPEGPVIVLVPATLLAQWLNESHQWLKNGSVDIFTYTGRFDAERRKDWWENVYKHSRLPEHQRIILATQPVSEA